MARDFWSCTKPPSGARVDWGDPINKGLLHQWLHNEGAGYLSKNGAGAMDATWSGTLGTQIGWAPTRHGPAVDLTFVSATPDLALPSKALGLFDPNVMSFHVVFIAPASLTTRSTLFGCDNTASNFQFEIGNGSGTATVSALIAGVFTATSVNNVLTANTLHQVVYTREGTGATHRIYVDGVEVALATNATNAYLDSITTRSLVRRASGSQVFAGKIIKQALWGRTLAKSDVQRLKAYPFAGVVGPTARRISFAGAAASTFIPLIGRGPGMALAGRGGLAA